jgi:hypothetical protein
MAFFSGVYVQVLSDLLTTIRTVSAHVAEYTYIVDFASSVTRLKPVKNHSVNVLSESQVIFFLNFPLTRGRMEVEEVFHGSKIGGLYVLFENLVPYSSFV